MRVPLARLAFARSGDKGDTANVGVIALAPAAYQHMVDQLTPARVKREIAELGRRIGRGYILLCDLETGTTDGQIKAAYEAASAL